MLAFQAGDESAFDSLVKKYQNAAIAMLRRILGPHAMVEDLAQEAFIRVYRARDRYKPAGKFTTFLYRITYNLALNQVRDNRRKQLFSLPQSPEGETLPLPDPKAQKPWEAANQALWADRVAQALQGLPRNQRSVLVFQHYDGLNLVEIAQILEVSPPAVKSLLYRARENMRILLQPFKDAEQDE